MAETNHSPQMGFFSGKSHLFPLRIYYENTDLGGGVYHADYVKFMERARTEYLRSLGFHQGVLKEQDVLFVVYDLSIAFKKPARMDDALLVRTTPTDIKNASLIFKQDILRLDPSSHPSAQALETATLLTSAEVKLCCVNQAGRPRALPDPIKTAFEQRK